MSGNGQGASDAKRHTASSHKRSLTSSRPSTSPSVSSSKPANPSGSRKSASSTVNTISMKSKSQAISSVSGFLPQASSTESRSLPLSKTHQNKSVKERRKVDTMAPPRKIPGAPDSLGKVGSGRGENSTMDKPLQNIGYDRHALPLKPMSKTEGAHAKEKRSCAGKDERTVGRRVDAQLIAKTLDNSSEARVTKNPSSTNKTPGGMDTQKSSGLFASNTDASSDENAASGELKNIAKKGHKIKDVASSLRSVKKQERDESGTHHNVLGANVAKNDSSAVVDRQEKHVKTAGSKPSRTRKVEELRVPRADEDGASNDGEEQSSKVKLDEDGDDRTNGDEVEFSSSEIDPASTYQSNKKNATASRNRLVDDCPIDTEADKRHTSRDQKEDSQMKDVGNGHGSSKVPYGRTRSASFDAREASGTTASNENVTEEGERLSLGPDVTTSQDRYVGGGRGPRNNENEASSALGETNLDNIPSFRSGVVGTVGIKESTGATAATTSFLEALSEEERRTRTRHLPAVDGFRILHKSEIKRDLAMARAMLSTNGGGSSSLPGKSGKGRRGGSSAENVHEKDGAVKSVQSKAEDRMDTDEEETSFDDTESDASGGGGRAPSKPARGDSAGSGLSGAFIPPQADSMTAKTSGGATATGDSVDNGGMRNQSVTKKEGSFNQHVAFGSPHIIESITAFNPPRPPESIGPKKKHRLLRWERNPQDVEVDLSNYRKTVQRTREELHNAEDERERIETVGATLRCHFLYHLKALREESVLLNQELGSTQIECAKAAELLTSKTRSRGAGKGSYAMRDVLSVLKARGAALNFDNKEENGLLSTQVRTDSNFPGIGGVSAISAAQTAASGFSAALPASVARGWILPGDMVSTPCGDGLVEHIFGPSHLDVHEVPPDSVRPKPKQACSVENRSFAKPTGTAVSLAAHISSPKSSNFAGIAQRHGFGGTGQATIVSDAHNAIPGSVGISKQQPQPKQALPLPRSIAPAGVNVPNGKAFPVMSGDMLTSSGALQRQPQQNAGPPAVSQMKIKRALGPPSERSTSQVQQQKQNLCILPPRVCVRLSYGVAYFPPESVTPLEDPSAYSDEKLLSRWIKMEQTAKTMGSCIDVAGMEGIDNTRYVSSLTSLSPSNGDAHVSTSSNCMSNGYDSSSPTQPAKIDDHITNHAKDADGTTQQSKTHMVGLDPSDSEKLGPSTVESCLAGTDGTSNSAVNHRIENVEMDVKNVDIVHLNRKKNLGNTLALNKGKTRLDNAETASVEASHGLKNNNHSFATSQVSGSRGCCPQKENRKRRFLPFGASMLPTPLSRGGPLSNAPLELLEESLDPVLFQGGGIMGKPTNPSVPQRVKQWEDQRFETYNLKGKVLQLRNELYRQRRIRILNERSCLAGKDRAHRVEGLLTEMKADLKSLKDRLQDELIELGIDQEKAGDMLASHYMEQQNTDNMDIDEPCSPMKRQKLGNADVLSKMSPTPKEKYSDSTVFLQSSKREFHAAGVGRNDPNENNHANQEQLPELDSNLDRPNSAGRRAYKRGRGDERVSH